MQLDNKIKLQNSTSNPDEFNLNLSLLRDDVNSLLLKGLQLQDSIFKYIAIYDTDYSEQLRFKIKNLKNQIESLKYLSQNQRYSGVKRYDFIDEKERLPFNQDFYKDPKTGFLYSDEDLYLKINTATSSLQVPYVSIEEKETDKIDVHSGTGISEAGSDDGKYNFYAVKNDSDAVLVTVEISLKENDKVNSLSFDPVTEFPYDLTGIEYFDTEWNTLQNSGLTGIFDYTEIQFPDITCTKIRLTFRLNKCKMTNKQPGTTSAQLLQTLMADYSEYTSMDDYSSQTSGDYYYYIFHWGIQNIKVSYYEKQGDGIFVSQPIKSQEPAHFSIDSIIQNQKNLSLEYYLYKVDYSNDSQDSRIPGSEALIPMLPSGITEIKAEIIKPMAAEQLGVSGSIEIDGIEYLASKVARLNFTPAGVLNLFENGSIVQNIPLRYAYQGKLIYFLNGYTPSDDAKITADYIPYHTTKGYFTPVDNPEQTLYMQQIYTYDPSNEVSLDLSDPNNPVEISMGGESYLRFLLPYSIDPASLEIDRLFLSGDIDNSAPAYMTSGMGQNVYVIGRKLYVPFDTQNYPKLYNCNYKIKAKLYQTGLTDAVIHYYNTDNSLMVNWEAFKKNYDNYGHTRTFLIVIARKNTIADEPVALDIKDIYLYTNKFTDLTIQPNTKL